MPTATSITGKLELNEGVVSVSLDHREPNVYMDAAVLNDLSGIEMALDRATVHLGPNASYQAPMALNIALTKQQMERLLYLLADKLDLPAFTEREWRVLSDAAKFASRYNFRDKHEAIGLAERIEATYR
jgi:hypothetical protein